VLLLRDEVLRAHHTSLVESHLRTVRAIHAGSGDLSALQARKLLDTLAVAARSRLHAESLRVWRDDRTLAEARALPADVVLTELLSSVPLLDRGELRARSRDAFTRQAGPLRVR
jgi:hypothetical protein